MRILRSAWEILPIALLGLLLQLMGSTPIAFGQAYLAKVKSATSLYSEPANDADVIVKLKKGAQVFLFSLEEDDGYYHALDIASSEEGWVNAKKVKPLRVIEENTEPLFQESGVSESMDPELVIFNNTSRTMTLRLDDVPHLFSPQERRSLSATAGTIRFVASAPGVIPLHGKETFRGNTMYNWEFYIVTRRVR